MKSTEEQRLEVKLRLWQTPGFYQFLKDLQEQKGPESDIKQVAETVRRLYIARIKELMPRSRYTQLKIKGL
jgi:hypothetical protein